MIATRSNNDVEGWHHGLHRHAAGRQNLNLYLLIDLLHQEARLTTPRHPPGFREKTYKNAAENVQVHAGQNLRVHRANYIEQYTDRTFVVYCPPSATNTLGFCHVKAEDGKNGKYHKCCCKGFLAKGKQEKSRAICDHLHVLFCCTELHNTVNSSTTVLSTSAAAPAAAPSS